jgi:hypothetical protein
MQILDDMLNTLVRLQHLATEYEVNLSIITKTVHDMQQHIVELSKPPLPVIPGIKQPKLRRHAWIDELEIGDCSGFLPGTYAAQKLSSIAGSRRHDGKSFTVRTVWEHGEVGAKLWRINPTAPAKVMT